MNSIAFLTPSIRVPFLNLQNHRIKFLNINPFSLSNFNRISSTNKSRNNYYEISSVSSCKLPLNPKALKNKSHKCLRNNPFWVLAPILKRAISMFRSSVEKWNLCVKEIDESLDREKGLEYLQNGGIGMALLSVTTSAKVRISPFVRTLAGNPTFVSSMFAWVIAQSMKMFINFCFDRKWDFRVLFASGGMPSSHSALCTALTTSVALCHGVADSLFPVCLGFSLIVMYDAIGVRRHAGMQAQVLNVIIEDLFQGHPISQRKLKELLGHTPSQVLAGAVLGILVAFLCCQGCLVYT
ncbi:hypothetical protein C5167_034059 [Papaver somniferum]|uniref:Uncharacterized protein n=1 Tax=Papaver somniferum TaxID=3469 RepID=A0A4Y7KG32_PAPSO|nr:uncharacterized protein LOC113299000 [Papaver somniferum]RZC70855.1 hypothetical protein C5167_034059 [Papaver somniferum]